MSISELYDAAKKYAEKIMMEQPSFFSGSGGSICLILTENQEIISGVTSIRIFDGRIENVPAEFNAAAYMLAEKKKKAVQMAIVSFYDYSVCLPSEKCLNVLLRADSGNAGCEVAVSPDESSSVSYIKAEYAAVRKDKQEIPEEYLSGFDFGESDEYDEPEEAPAATEPVPVQSQEMPAIQPEQPNGADYQQPYANPFPQQPYPQQPAADAQPVQQPYPQQPAAAPFPQQPYPQQPAGAEYQQQFAQQPADAGFPQQTAGSAEFQQPYQQQPYQQPYMQQPYQQPYMQQPYQQQYMQQPYQQQYMQQPYQQPYMQQPYQQQSVYLDNLNPYPANPYNNSPVQGSAPSVQISDINNTPVNNAAPVNNTALRTGTSQYMTETEENIMKKKLASLLGDDSSKTSAPAAPETPAAPEVSKEEMMKKMKQQKKATKGGIFGRK